MNLSDIVNVKIVTSNVAVKMPGFGVPLIMGSHTRFPERIRYYNEPDDMLDVFQSSDAEYLSAVALCSQNPQVDRFAVGRRALRATPKYRIGIVGALNSKTYAVKVNGKLASFTSDVNATLAEISAGLTAAINGLAGGPGCTVAEVPGVGVDLTATNAGDFLRVEVLDAAALSADPTHADPGIADDLSAVALENPDFYGVCLTSCGTLEILAAAAWTEAHGRLFVQLTNQTACVTTPGANVGASAKAANYFRTALIYHADNGSFADAAWLGECLPREAGSETWKFATLAGVTVSTLTPTQITNLRTNNLNFYVSAGGVSIVCDGKVAAGEWIDTIRGRDWLAADMQTGVFVAVKSARDTSGKLAFDDAGIGVVESAVTASLARGVARGFLSNNPAPVVTVPKAAAVATVDRAARNLPSVKWKATLQGAIHATEISGAVSP